MFKEINVITEASSLFLIFFTTTLSSNTITQTVLLAISERLFTAFPITHSLEWLGFVAQTVT